jgi:hypothetical protein
MESFAETKAFLALWVHDGDIVGLFLEGGTPEWQAALPRLARERPKVGRETERETQRERERQRDRESDRSEREIRTDIQTAHPVLCLCVWWWARAHPSFPCLSRPGLEHGQARQAHRRTVL